MGNTQTVCDCDHLIVDTLNDLILATIADETLATTLGYVTKGDKGASNFYWDSISTETPDGIFVVKSANTIGRWKKILNGAIRLKEAGVKTDGTSQTILLNAIFNNITIWEVLHDEGVITIDGSTAGVDAQEKIIRVSNGATFAGIGTLNKALIIADDFAHIFSTSLTVTNLTNTKTSVAWFGAKADNITNNLPSFNRCVASCRNKAALYIPANRYDTNDNDGDYYFDDTWVINDKIEIFGDGKTKSCIRFRTGICGIQLTINCQSSTLRDFWIKGNITEISSGTNSSTAHGLLIGGANNSFSNLYITAFDGNGFCIDTTSNNTNANNNIFINCKAVYNGGSAFYFVGNNSNSNTLLNCNGTLNARWGYWDNSGIGNTNIGFDASSNGDFAYWADYLASAVLNGRVYYCIQNHTNVEPGVSSGWQDFWKDLRSAGNFPDTWSSTKHYVTGGGYAFTGQAQINSMALNCYVENDQLRLLNANGVCNIYGGTLAAGGVQGGMTNRQGILTTRNFQAFDEDSQASVSLRAKSSGGDDGFFGFRDHLANSYIGFSYLKAEKSAAFAAGLPTDHAGYIFTSQSDPAHLGKNVPLNGAVAFNTLALPQLTSGWRCLGFATASPTSGTYATGDYFLDNGDGANNFAFVCVLGGDPGTWITKTASNGPTSWSDIPSKPNDGLFIYNSETQQSANININGNIKNNGKVFFNGATTDDGFDGFYDGSNGAVFAGRILQQSGNSYLNAAADANTSIGYSHVTTPNSQLQVKNHSSANDHVVYVAGINNNPLFVVDENTVTVRKDLSVIENAQFEKPMFVQDKVTVESLRFSTLPLQFIDDSAAIAAGLSSGDVYRTGNTLKVVLPI